MYLISKFMFFGKNKKIHTYLPRFIPEWVAETSQISFETPVFYQNDLAMRNAEDVTGGKPFAV
jgi:hypothetical protein